MIHISINRILILLLLCASGARAWQDSIETPDEHATQNTERKEEKYEGKYNGDSETMCQQASEADEGTCFAPDADGTHDETEFGALVDEEADQSALSMLEQEDQEFLKDGDVGEDENCPHPATERDTCASLESYLDSGKEEDQEELISDALVQEATVPHLVEEEEEEEERKGVEEATELPRTPENASRELKESEPEQENVPLREILLKLKPEGLTDDDDDQTSDYLTGESSLGDESEVEEEALVSSGSAEKQEQNLDTNGTKGSSDANGGNSSGGNKKAVCSDSNVTEPITDVEIINATALLKLLQVDPNVTSRTSSGPCYLIYFFSPYCPFSIMGSPYVNALARSIPNIPIYGLDSIEHHSVNARYGVMGTPTLLLFHNGNGVGRYNASEYSVSQLISFVKHYTDQELTDINVTSSDFRADLPSQLAEARPYALWAAWIFLLSFASWLFLTSDLCARLTEAILNNWREAEAQNDHQD